MLPINKKTSGFTMIEILIFISILIVILGISFSFILITFGNASKSEALKEVKQNGNFALSSMEKFIISAKEVECSVDRQSLDVTMLDGTYTTFSCTSGKIASDSAVLTNDKVNISDCSFVCTIEPGLPAQVEINFTLSTVGSLLRANENSSLNFNTKLVVRNQKN